MIYLASPYTHPQEHIRTRRYILTRDFVHQQLVLGVAIFSPIVYTHPMAVTHQMPIEADFWKFFNDEFITRCSALWVLTIDGWEQSVGVKDEIAIAAGLNLPIEYKEPPKYAYF